MNDATAEAPPRSSRWDANASYWVQIIREHRDKYRNELTDPAMLRAIGDARGLDVLDAGCGEGYLSRILAGPERDCHRDRLQRKAHRSSQRSRTRPTICPSHSMSAAWMTCHTQIAPST